MQEPRIPRKLISSKCCAQIFLHISTNTTTFFDPKPLEIFI